MDTTREGILKLGKDGEERLLLSQLLDKQRQAQRYQQLAATFFLDLHQQALCRQAMARLGQGEAVLAGGFPQAERRCALFLPDYWESLDQVPPEEWKHLDLLCHVHRWVRRAVQEGSWDRQRFEALVREMEDRQPELLVTMDEVGCGIVPMEAEERRFREAVGEAGQILAAHSREVWRVICGAGARIR